MNRVVTGEILHVLRRPVMLIMVCAVAVLPPLWGQTISDVVFLPQTYHVGDIVEARIVVRGVESENLTIPAELPRLPWITVHSVTVIQRADGVELRVVFQPFFRGTRELPRIGLGEVTISGVSPFVTSVFQEGEDRTIQSVRDQLLLPGTHIQFSIALIVLIAVPTVVIFTGGWGKRRFIAIRARYRENRPFRAFQKSIRMLGSQINELDGKTFYIRLLDICREYLDRRLHGGVRSATTGEMERVLKRAAVGEDERTRLVALFQFGDLVKFASKRVSLAERNEHIEEVRSIIATLQEQKKRNVDS